MWVGVGVGVSDDSPRSQRPSYAKRGSLAAMPPPKSKASPLRPASAAVAPDWPRATEASGSLRRDLVRAERCLRRASRPKPSPARFRHGPLPLMSPTGLSQWKQRSTSTAAAAARHLGDGRREQHERRGRSGRCGGGGCSEGRSRVRSLSEGLLDVCTSGLFECTASASALEPPNRGGIPARKRSAIADNGRAPCAARSLPGGGRKKERSRVYGCKAATLMA